MLLSGCSRDQRAADAETRVRNTFHFKHVTAEITTANKAEILAVHVHDTLSEYVTPALSSGCIAGAAYDSGSHFSQYTIYMDWNGRTVRSEIPAYEARYFCLLRNETDTLIRAMAQDNYDAFKARMNLTDSTSAYELRCLARFNKAYGKIDSFLINGISTDTIDYPSTRNVDNIVTVHALIYPKNNKAVPVSFYYDRGDRFKNFLGFLCLEPAYMAR